MRNKQTIITSIAAILLCVAVMVSCKKKKQETVATVSFRSDIIPMLTASCAVNTSCHSGSRNDGDNINLDSNAAYNAIIAKHLVNTATPTASLMYVEVSSGSMPKAPYAPLSADKITLILNWIKQGALNN